MALSKLPSDQFQLTNVGTEFHYGPVVNLIVANLPLDDKLRLLQQIEEEDGKRPPASRSPMFGWKEAIVKALNNQRMIRNFRAELKLRNLFQCEEFNMNRRDETDGQCFLPNEWLASREEFERVLVWCPNLTAIHLRNWFDERNFVEQDILDVILNRATKLTSLTFDGDDDSQYETLMQIFRKRRDTMRYIHVFGLNLANLKECIETIPNLETICSAKLSMNFVGKCLILSEHAFWTLTQTGKLSEVCNYFNRFNWHYKKSSSDGVQLNGFDCHGFRTMRAIYDELVDSFAELQYIMLDVKSDMDIRQLRTMKNLKRLTLNGNHESIQYIEQLLPNFGMLEELELEKVKNCNSALEQIHVHCPHLRRIGILYAQIRFPEYELIFGESDFPEFAVETINSICQLPKLEYFDVYTDQECHESANRYAIEQKRLGLNADLSPNLTII